MSGIALPLAVLASTVFTVILLLLPSRYVKHSPQKVVVDGSLQEPNVSVQVLVLGDIGRSPRMQYHAQSIAKHGGRVELIGYQESPLFPALVDNPLVSVIALPPPPPLFRSKSLPFAIVGPLKVLWQIWSLFHALGYRTKPSRWLLVQNPPSIPTLFIALVTCCLRNTHLIIDWHNYGWTILAGTRGKRHPFVIISKYYEAILGAWAPTAGFTVSDAMMRQLRNPPYDIRSPLFTLHDRPAAIFQPIFSVEARREFLQRLPETSKFTTDILSGRTKLLVSSTSWTPDEDFSLLLSALTTYASSNAMLPHILAVITGKGPQKQLYLDRISALNGSGKLAGITISTAWLSAEDYATLLACADLGICLHTSSSGVDLPMKVVDMFGTGLPVVSYSNYESWGELVTENINGRGFITDDELAKCLEDLFAEKEGKELARLREGALMEGKRRWDEEWGGVAGRLLGLCE